MTIAVLDNFTDSDSTGLNSHTPDTDTVGSGWIDATALSGNGTIQGNQLQLGVDNRGHVIDSGQSDCDIDVDWILSAGNDRNSVIFRWQDTSNYWLCNFREPNSDIQIVENITVRASSSYTWSGSSYAINVNLNGTGIDCSVDGVSQVTYTSSSYQTETHHGIFRNSGANGTRLDNFQIATLGGGTGTTVLRLAGDGGLAGTGGLAGRSGGLAG